MVWIVVIGVRAIAGSKRVTSNKIASEIEDASFDDWSEGIPSGASPAQRQERLDEIAELFNRLDYQERERTRERRIGEKFYLRLSDSEKDRFARKTLAKSMESMIRALDGMDPEERRKVVEDGLRDIESGRTEEEMMRARELSDGLLEQITQEGMRAYFEDASADTKLDLAPLVEAMDEVVKGMNGHDIRRPK